MDVGRPQNPGHRQGLEAVMPPQSASPIVLRRIAWLCALLVLLIAFVSAFLRLSKAGLGCEPWPACYGEALRTLQRGGAIDDAAAHTVALARLAHRVLASTALVLVLILAFGHLGAKPVRRVPAALSLALLACALFLAALGWLTASSRVPAVAMGNLLGGFAMLALSWRLAAPENRGAATSSSPSGWTVLALALLVIQIALGGLVSAGHASLSCADTAECLRQATQQGWPWSTLNPWREPVFNATPSLPVNPSGALAQGLHRGMAVAVSLSVLGAAWAAHRAGRGRAAAALLVLWLLQMAAGLWLVTSGVPLAAALVHNVLAALMLAMLAREI